MIDLPDNTRRYDIDFLRVFAFGLLILYHVSQFYAAGEGWHVVIPDKCRVGHEAHFRNVMDAYLEYLVEGRLPDWEVPNMLAKYYITTKSLELARK